MERLMRISFGIGIVFIIVGAWFKLLHYQNADIFLTIGIIASIIFLVIVLYEIHSSKKVRGPEKIMWTVGFIFINTITGLMHFLIGRQKIIKKHNPNIVG
jgi:hypothetical protein